MFACPLLHFLHTHVRSPRAVDGCSSQLLKTLVLFVCGMQWRRFMMAVGDYNCTLQAGSGNTTASSASKGRRLLEWVPSEGLQHNPEYPARRLRQAPGSGAQYSCKKLGAGGCTLWVQSTGAVSGILQQQCSLWGAEGYHAFQLICLLARVALFLLPPMLQRCKTRCVFRNNPEPDSCAALQRALHSAALTRFCLRLLSTAAIAGGRVAVQAPTSGYRSR